MDGVVIEKTSSFSVSKRVYFILKRLTDIVFALLGCILLVPIALIVKITYMINGDFNSIFFKQKRIGKNGKEFNLYKFRTMVVGADEILFKLLEENEEIREEYNKNKKLKKDPRITKIGGFLRKSSIDELPQFINILKGNMSLIGNRPYLPREKIDMGKYYEDIIKTKPGLTGYWQVSGRSNTSFEYRLKLEREYSNICSLKLDLKIFFKTIIVVLKSSGAK